METDSIVNTAAATTSQDSVGPGPSNSAQPMETVQYTRRQVVGIWAAAALPMAALAWVVAPLLATLLDGPTAQPRSLLLSLTFGLVWQFVLVVLLVHRERGLVRWSVLKDALWLRAPRSPRTGHVGGMLWLVLIPFMLLFAAEEFIPAIPAAAGHDMLAFLGSDAGTNLLAGSWGWVAVIVALAVFNTVLGEELLFRGLLLPRMQAAFGRVDWVANGVLFAVYHLHLPWAIPTALVDTFALAYPSRRYRSAWIGIAVHSTQSILIIALTLALVLQ
ncbi:MAG: CPBP family intramembrane glutamic endopeptidase [Aeromicrobium sp.]